MILTYTLDRFVTSILTGTKLHTIRDDPHDRWHAGRTIQHWRGNPRNVRSKKKPYQFAAGVCISTQVIHIERWPALTVGVRVWVDSQRLPDDEVRRLARNDDLSLDEFRDRFVPAELGGVYAGKIIHFTSLQY